MMGIGDERRAGDKGPESGKCGEDKGLSTMLKIEAYEREAPIGCNDSRHDPQGVQL